MGIFYSCTSWLITYHSRQRKSRYDRDIVQLKQTKCDRQNVFRVWREFLNRNEIYLRESFPAFQILCQSHFFAPIVNDFIKEEGFSRVKPLLLQYSQHNVRWYHDFSSQHERIIDDMKRVNQEICSRHQRTQDNQPTVIIDLDGTIYGPSGPIGDENLDSIQKRFHFVAQEMDFSEFPEFLETCKSKMFQVRNVALQIPYWDRIIFMLLHLGYSIHFFSSSEREFVAVRIKLLLDSVRELCRTFDREDLLAKTYKIQYAGRDSLLYMESEGDLHARYIKDMTVFVPEDKVRDAILIDDLEFFLPPWQKDHILKTNDSILSFLCQRPDQKNFQSKTIEKFVWLHPLYVLGVLDECMQQRTQQLKQREKENGTDEDYTKEVGKSIRLDEGKDSSKSFPFLVDILRKVVPLETPFNRSDPDTWLLFVVQGLQVLYKNGLYNDDILLNPSINHVLAKEGTIDTRDELCQILIDLI